MEKLVSMTEFVLNGQQTADYIKLYDGCFKYALFLRRNLTLSMFIVCDKNENPIKEYDWVAPDGTKWEDYEKELIEGKKKVLFEGFELKGRHLWNKDKLFMISDNYKEYFENEKDIEWLVNQSIHEFILTESAKQQLS